MLRSVEFFHNSFVILQIYNYPVLLVYVVKKRSRFSRFVKIILTILITMIFQIIQIFQRQPVNSFICQLSTYKL